MLKHSTPIEYDHIQIVDFQKSKHAIEHSLIEKSIISSLRLIKQLEPQDYIRIQKKIKWIIQSKRLSKNRYLKEHQLYGIKYIQYWDDQKLVDIYNAGVLLGDSYYSCLISSYTELSNEKKVKIDHICILKEKQFYKKVEKLYPEYKDLLIEYFI